MQRFDGRVCLITGAARGIGLAIARRLQSEGGTILLTDKDEQGGREAARALGCEFHLLDVANEGHWKQLEASVPAPHVVVNNAGVTGFEEGPVSHDPENASLQDWRAVHAVNLDGTFLGCRFALRAFQKNGTDPVSGFIVNISSRSGLVGIPGAAAYASSKAAVRNHTKTVALYAAQKGWKVCCNSVHPAAILTPMWEPMLGEEEGRADRMAKLVADTPLRRFGQADEVAAMVAMLASDEAGYVTGSEFNIDGGLLAGSLASPG